MPVTEPALWSIARRRAAVQSLRRLAAVRATALLDTRSEEAFDRLTSLASTLLDAPFAFATVVDDRRSYWKSCIGIPAGAPRENSVEDSFCQYVVGSEEELIVDDVTLDPRTRENPSIEAMGVRAWAGFPLRGPDGDVIGSFCVVDQRPRTWTERDVELLRVLSAAAAGEIALRSALRSAEALAATLQESLLPPTLPAIGGLDVAAHYRPARGGTELVGDFYDIYPLEPGRWSIAIGDVCGKGVEAAKTTALARHALVAASRRAQRPSDALRVLDETLKTHQPGGPFITAIFGWIEQTDGRFDVQLACAGHEPALVVRDDGRVEAATEHGTLLGLVDHLTLVDSHTRLGAGDMLVLFTDGVTETRRDGELFGVDRLISVLSHVTGDAAADVIGRIERAVDAHSLRADDDRAIVVVRVPPAIG